MIWCLPQIILKMSVVLSNNYFLSPYIRRGHNGENAIDNKARAARRACDVDEVLLLAQTAEMLPIH
jgi:hypothetical protein